MLGVLAVLGKEGMEGEVVQEVVAVLLRCCGVEDVEVNTEALNVFFDVFCDENYDEVLARAGVLGMMTGGVEVFRSKIRSCEDDEVREHAQEAFENLIEFIKYKAQHIAG